jgi:hypothetical protein
MKSQYKKRKIQNKFTKDKKNYPPAKTGRKFLNKSKGNIIGKQFEKNSYELMSCMS